MQNPKSGSPSSVPLNPIGQYPGAEVDAKAPLSLYTFLEANYARVRLQRVAGILKKSWVGRSDGGAGYTWACLVPWDSRHKNTVVFQLEMDNAICCQFKAVLNIAPGRFKGRRGTSPGDLFFRIDIATPLEQCNFGAKDCYPTWKYFTLPGSFDLSDEEKRRRQNQSLDGSVSGGQNSQRFNGTVNSNNDPSSSGTAQEQQIFHIYTTPPQNPIHDQNPVPPHPIRPTAPNTVSEASVSTANQIRDPSRWTSKREEEYYEQYKRENHARLVQERIEKMKKEAEIEWEKRRSEIEKIVKEEAEKEAAQKYREANREQ